MGAAASKKLRAPPQRSEIFSASASDVSGPVAITVTVSSSGISVNSFEITSISGSSLIFFVTA